jgi:hypothetical protein
MDLICSTSCALCSMKAWKSAALGHELAGWNGVPSRLALQRWQARQPLPPPSSGGAPFGGLLVLVPALIDRVAIELLAEILVTPGAWLDVLPGSERLIVPVAAPW